MSWKTLSIVLIILLICVAAALVYFIAENDECRKSITKLEDQMRDLNGLLNQCNLEKRTISSDLDQCMSNIDVLNKRHSDCQDSLFASENLGLECKSRKNGCYYRLAEEMRDPSLCQIEPIETSNSMSDSLSWCLSNVGVASENINVCDMINETTTSAKSFCYEKLAIGARDTSLCDSMTSVGNRDECYSQIARQTRRPALCQNLTDLGNIRAWCYMGVAVALKDPSLCERIKEIDSGIMSSCFKEAAADRAGS